MEIDKKIIKKLIDTLEELKSSLGKNLEISENKNSDEIQELEKYKSVKKPM